jgi:hypothetical protein
MVKVVNSDDLRAWIGGNEYEEAAPPPPLPDEFRLVWPTPLPKVVTQWYGINPQWYSGFGLPGHEGIDLRAYLDVEIYAAAAGQVIRVESQDNNNYGVHVRIEHVRPEGTWKSVYAHLRNAQVQVGDQVNAGQLLGLSDDTGNSNGSHLHLTLKHVGKGSPWMDTGDIVNPVPYFVDLFPRCTIPPFTGAGWRMDVGGNFRTSPVVGDNLIRWIPAGSIVEAHDFGGDGGDWWQISFEGVTGWFWNPGYKLSAL